MAQPAQGSGIRIGEVFGIPIYLHPSWFIIFLLITLSLRTQFTSQHPGWITRATLGAWNNHQRAFLRVSGLPRTQPQRCGAQLPNSGEIHHAIRIWRGFEDRAGCFEREAGIQYRHRRTSIEPFSGRLLLAGVALLARK